MVKVIIILSFLIKFRPVTSLCLSFFIDINYQIEWLQENVDPWETVQSYWSTTFPNRRELLKDEDYRLNTYIHDYPCLQMRASPQLVNLNLEIKN